LSTFHIPYLSVARASGADAEAFLQSQLSADVAALEDGASGFACYCTPKGQVLGLLLIGRRADDFLLAAHTALLPGLLKRLGMYVLRSRVSLVLEPDLCVSGANGPEWSFAADAPDVADTDAWRAEELRAGVAWLDSDTAEKFIPQMLGYDTIGAVSFQKGCYPGQEIVARARYLGKVKRLPAVVEIEGRPGLTNGSKLRLGRDGEWTDAVLVDHARDGERTVLFTVARDPGETVFDEIEYDGVRYRCATT
jgi:hypothetical protein